MAKKSKCAKSGFSLELIAMILLIIGGLNWGLAVFNINLVSLIAGTGILADIIYALVGISAIIVLINLFKK